MFPSLIVSSGDGRKQCQQPYPTHQPLKPFELSCTVSPTSPSTPDSSSLSIDVSAVHAISDTTSSRRVRCDYQWYSRIFRPTNNIRLYLLAAAIPKYLEVRCYGQAYVISALTYRSRSPILFSAFSYAAACGICGSFTYSCARETRGENIRKYVCIWGIWSVRSWRNLR